MIQFFFFFAFAEEQCLRNEEVCMLYIILDQINEVKKIYFQNLIATLTNKKTNNQLYCKAIGIIFFIHGFLLAMMMLRYNFMNIHFVTPFKRFVKYWNGTLLRHWGHRRWKRCKITKFQPLTGIAIEFLRMHVFKMSFHKTPQIYRKLWKFI